MTKILKMQTTTINRIITYSYVLLFLYAATSKLIEYDKFQLQMSKSPIITDYAHVLVWMVPTLEIIISIMLLIKRTVTIGFYAAFSLMILFTGYICAILNFTDYAACSCLGPLEKMTWDQYLILNVVFIALAVAVIQTVKSSKYECSQKTAY